MNDGQQPKRYFVQLPGYQQGEIWDEDKFNRNKDKLFQDHQDAIVLETSPMAGDTEIQNNDAFTVHLPGFPEAEVWDGEKLARNREQLMKDHPDAEISRTRQVNYWGDKLGEIYDRESALKKELEGLPAEAEGAELRNMGEEDLVAEAGRLAKEKPGLGRRREINRELEQLYRMREQNPAWRQYWANIDKGIDEDFSRIDKMQSDLRKNNPEADRHYRNATRFMAGPGSAMAVGEALASDPEYNSAIESFAAAKLMLEDAKKAANAPSKYSDETGVWSDFWEGVKGGAPEALSAAQLLRAGLNMHLVDAIKKIHEQEGKDANILELVKKDYFDDLGYLNAGQKELVKAFVKKAEVEGGRGDTISRSYQAGQSAIQSLGFMLDFAMLGGVGEKAAEATVGGLVKAAGRNELAKLGAETLYGTVKALAMTPLMPSSYGNFMNNMLQFNDAGGVDLSGKAIARAIGDVIIENVSETIGSKPMDLIGLPLSKVKFPDWAKAMRHSPIAAALKQAGYNGFFEEIVEEWTGNALRVMTGVDKDALKDFATIDQQLITLGSFAPMSIFGGALSTAQFATASKEMKKAGTSLQAVLDATAMSDEAKAAAMKTQDFSTPEDFAHHMTDVYQQILENGGNEEEAYKAVMEYTKAVSTYKVMDGMFEEQKDIERSRRLAEMDMQMGNENWHHYGNNGASYVRIITDVDGNESFVVAEDEAGLALVDRDGNKKMLSNEQLMQGIMDGTLTDSGEQYLFDYLDKQTEIQHKAVERERVEAEAKANVAQLAQRTQPGMQVNVGTDENPDMATILGTDADKYIVQKSSGEVSTYTAEEMANMLGIRLIPETDAEIQAREAERDEQRKIKREIANNYYKGMPLTWNDRQYTLVGVTRGEGTMEYEDGTVVQTFPFDVHVKNEQGEDMTIGMTEDEFDSVYSGWMAKEREAQAAAESVQEETPETPVEDNIPRDFRGNPLPMRTNKQTGQQVVDGNALWNNDPEAWAKWNDANPTQKVTSKERLEYTIGELNKEIDKDTKAVQKAALKGIDEDEMDKMEDALGKKLARRELLQSILDQYNMPAVAGPTVAGEQRKAAADQTKKEQQAGFPGIQQKWNETPKVVGAADEIRLPNGETVSGHYVLTEAEAPTPSHNPANGFAMTEGFPVDENGKTVNDRDYEHDQSAQNSVLEKAANYDQRALQTPVIVSADGVVLSGNDRTMASQIAAANNTDKAYTDYLAKYSQKYGFSAEQVGQFQHPRVVFVPDAEMPYNAATFAKFNAEDKKSQSKTEKAVKAGKTLTPETLGSLASLVDRYDDINALYNDAAGVDELLNILLASEVISQEQVAALKDGDKLSGTGMDLLESTLIGAALDEEAVRIAMSDPAIRKSVVSAISQIIIGNTLADYNLRAELTDAIQLVAAGKNAKEIKFGESVQGYIRQQHLFQDDVVAEATVQMLADAINDRKTSFLKKVLSLYNRDAVESATGQMNLLTGDILTREAILRNILEYLGYDTRIIFNTSERAAEQAAAAEPAPAADNQAEQNAPAVQGDAGSRTGVNQAAREEVAALLEQGNVGEFELANYMSDDEVAEFLRLWSDFQPYNDALGEGYSRLANELKSKDKKVHDAAQAEIDKLEQAQVDAFAPVQAYVDSLIAKYDLYQEAYERQLEDIEDAAEEGFADVEEPAEDDELEDEIEAEDEESDEPKPTKGKKGGKKGKAKKAEEQPYVVKGGASEATIAKQTYTQEEWEEFVYGYSTFTIFESKKTGERVQIYMVDDTHPVYHDHRCIVSRRLPGPNGKMSEDGHYKGPHTETHTTTDYLIKYLKANKFKPVFDSANKSLRNKPYKNKYGYWVNQHGVVMNPIRIELPSVKKNWANFTDAKFYQDDNGKWHAGGSASHGTGGGSLVVNGVFDKKSEAIKATIDALVRYRAAHPGNNTDLRDVDNLIKALKTKTLPQALLDEGFLNDAPRLEIGAEELDNGVQGLLFGDETETSAPVAESKPKRKRAAKKDKVEQAAQEAVESPEGTELEDEPIVQIEDEEGTPGNYHWISERVCTNPTIITVPGMDRLGPNSKIALAEKDGQWYAAAYVTADGGKGSAWGSQIPTFKGSHIPYSSRYAAVNAAINSLRWMLDNPAKKTVAAYGETFNETKELIDYLVKMELPASQKQDNRIETITEGLKAFDDAKGKGKFGKAFTNLMKSVGEMLGFADDELNDALKDSAAQFKTEQVRFEDLDRAKAYYVKRVRNALKEATGNTSMSGYGESSPLIQQEEKPKNDFVDNHIIVAGVPSAKKETPAYGSQNTVVTQERYEELKRKMLERLGQLNAGFDPNIFALGVEMAAYHVEAGARKFVDFAKRMLADLGDAIRPYLKAIYNGARDLPGMEKVKDEMDSPDAVASIDVDSINLEEPNAEQEESEEKAPEQGWQGWEERMRAGEDGADVQGFDFMSEYNILDWCNNYIDELKQDGLNIAVVDMRVIGSRAYGMAREDSDLDVLVEYEGDMKEDEVFNALNEDPLTILGIKVDFFPVRSQESGTMTEWLETHNNGRPIEKEQKKTASEPVVKQVNVEGLLGAVSDMYAGKRGEVKLSEFAEPVEQEKATNEQDTELEQLEDSMQEQSYKLTNALMKAFDSNTLQDDYFAERKDLGFVSKVTSFYFDGGGVKASVIYDYKDGKYVNGRYKVTRTDSSYSHGIQENTRTFSLDTPIDEIVATAQTMQGKEMPAKVDETAKTGTIGELGKYTHTKTGKEMSIVRLTGDRVSSDEFKKLKARAKEFGGYWSSFGSSKGFLFDNEEDAIKFNTITTNENVSENTDKQTAANTAVISSEAASITEQASALAETAEPADERKANRVIQKIDNQLDKIDDQLALLGYYEAEQDVPFNESYGYMKSAEKKAVKDADKLAKKLAADLGIEAGKKRLAEANIAPAGGEVSFRLPLNEGRELYVVLYLSPAENDALQLESMAYRNMGSRMDIMYRVENPNATGQSKYETANSFATYNVSYSDLLKRIRYEAQDFLPKQPAETPAPAKDEGPVDILQVAKEQAEKNRKSSKKSVSSQEDGDAMLGGLFDDLYNDEQDEQTPVVNTPAPSQRVKPTDVNGFKKGEKVLYTPNQGDRKPQEATIYDFEYDGRPVLDAGLAPILYEVVDWEQIQKIDNEPVVDSTDNGLQRNDESSAEGTPAESVQRGEGAQETTGRTGEEAGQEGGRPNSERAGGSQSPVRNSRHRYDDSVKRNTHNNRVSKGEVVFPKTPAARFKANIAAIRLLKELQDSGKKATKEQMAVLRQYTGWGGLGGYFNNEYSPENRELRSLLTEEEMQAAALSINTAYYTPVEVIDAMWDVAKRLGFEGGNVLEGSAGIGNILASMPKNISEHSEITAVELDNITGGILELLYPDANVLIKGFEEVNIPNNSVDLAITNVPFGDIQMYDEKEKDLTRKFGGKIHDFCIAKNIRKLAEGGIGIFISTRGTLDNSSKALRQWIVNEGGADVIGVFRLNNATFEGTKATSDIIVVRKRVNGQVSPNAIDVSTTQITRRETFDTGKTERNSKTRNWEPITAEGVMEINSYFAEHPENMGGEMGFGFEHKDTFRPASAGLWPSEKIDQMKRLNKWAKQFSSMQEEQAASVSEQESAVEEASNATKEGQLVTNSKGDICVSRGGKAVPIGVNTQKVKGYSKAQCLNDYNALKTAINEVLDYQTKNESDEGLKPLLAKLNKAYDIFRSRYGQLNRNTSISFLRNDVDFPATAAVEDYKETKGIDGKVKITVKKTGIFNGRVLGAKRVPTPSSAKDGVIVSINQFGRIDIPFIAEALGKSEEDVRAEILSTGLGFENPLTGNIEVEYEYLSGNVREKLEYAREHNSDGRYDANIKALEKVIPAEIPAHLIEFSLGSDWLPVSLYTDYGKERFGLNDNFVPQNFGGNWSVRDDVNIDERNEKNRAAGVRSEALDMFKYGHELMLAAMNKSSVQFSRTYKDDDGHSHTEHDKEATQAAATKIDEMRDDFKEWCRAKILGDNELSERITKTYNDTFNAIVPKEIRDTFLPEHFEGQVLTMGKDNKPFHLYPHQSKAVIRATTEPLMMAHEVGTGKTFTLISTAMEMRRLGTAKKPMIVVQNATLGQFVSSAKALYPNAKVLTISEADRTVEGRSAFYAKIKYNDWDIIIVPQSVFEMIPDSEERKRAFIQEKIDEKKFILEQAKQAKNQAAQRRLQEELKDLEYERDHDGEKRPKKGKNDAKKAAEAIANATAKAKKQLDRKTDDVADFDEMGIDALLIDEAHSYKHLGFSTSMQRGVKGVDPSYSKKSAGVYLKTRAVFDKVGWKNVVFATGTPISNTAAEIWTFMKYLMPDDVMRSLHIYYFDDFVSNFGNISQSLEFTTSGKFKENARFASYTNLPELIRIWSSVTDTVLTKEAVAATATDGNVEERLDDKVPVMETWTDDKGEKHENQVRDIYLPQSPALLDIMTAIRARLEWYESLTGKEKKEYSYIPLTMFGLAKMAAIDPRLVDKNANDEPLSKTNKVVEETLKALGDSKRYKGTAALFCDNFRRWDSDGSGKRVEGFNIFEEIKRKLVAAGVPEDQIVIMKSGMTTAAKEKIFARVNAGEVRVIMGTTATLGTGVNIQERLFFEGHIDAPNRPMDYTQRMGRILRQGNLHKEWGIPVRVVRFGVEDSLDVTAYQRLSTKSKFINSVMDGKPLLANGMENRILEEEEEGEFDNPVAVLSGSQYALLKSQAERELRKLRNKKEQHRQDQIYIERQLKKDELRIGYNESKIEEDKKNLAKVREAFPDGKVKEITIAGQKVSTTEQINAAIKEKVVAPMRAIIDAEKKKAAQAYTYDRPFSETKSFKFTFNGIPVKVSVEVGVSRIYDFEQRKNVVSSSAYTEYTCPELGINWGVRVPGGLNGIKEVVDEFITSIATGQMYENDITLAESRIEHIKSDDELMRQRRGKPFADEDKLAKQEEIVKDYTQKMRDEMAEKEAKYAEMAKNTKTNFSLDDVEIDDEEDGEEASAEYSDMDGNGFFSGIEDRKEDEDAKTFTQRVVSVVTDRYPFLKGKIVTVSLPNLTPEMQAKLPNGRYSYKHKKITIFAKEDRNSADAVERTIMHEAIHMLIHDFGWNKDRHIINLFNTSLVASGYYSLDEYREMFADVMATYEEKNNRKYTNEEIREEMMTFELSQFMLSGLAGEFIAGAKEFMPELGEQLEKLVKTLGYEPTKESESRMDAEVLREYREQRIIAAQQRNAERRSVGDTGSESVLRDGTTARERGGEGDVQGTGNEGADLDADGVSYELVTDPETIERLERVDKEYGYRTVVLNEDGSFSSPKASKLGKKGEKSRKTSSFFLKKWEGAEENPDLATEDGKISLVDSVGAVDYNPYIHIRPDAINKQFTAAWRSPKQVYIRTAYPKSELTSGYKAEKAKLSVGRHPWNNGDLILSRWDKPERIVSWEEVADQWEKEFKDTGVTFDIVNPGLLPVLAARGVEILPPKKAAGQKAMDAYNNWLVRTQSANDIREKAAALLSNYENQDGEETPWMSERELLDAIEREMPNNAETEALFELVNLYRELSEEDFNEGRRDYSGGEMEDVFRDIISMLEALANGVPVRNRTAYHGSGAKFESFDNDKINSGEGAQAHGYGHYVALQSDTAKRYARSIGNYDVREAGRVYWKMREIDDKMDLAKTTDAEREELKKQKQILINLENILESRIRPKNIDSNSQLSLEDSWRVLDAVASVARYGDVATAIEQSRQYLTPENAGTPTYEMAEYLTSTTPEDWETNRNLYTVEIPEDTGENYLDEQKELSKEQRKVIADALRKLPEDSWKFTYDDNALFGDLTANQLANSLSKRLLNGYEMYSELAHGLGSKKAASEFLSNAGFVGIKYDGRTDGPCAVIFNDGDIQIVNHEMFRQGEESTPDPVSYSESMGAKRLAASETARKAGIEIEFRSPASMRLNGKPLAGRWINGKMYICLEHCRDNDDAVRTVLHEGVGHNGLRRLIGDENMTAFCLDMFRRLPNTARQVIADAAVSEYGGNVAEAVEEYLAERAEVMDFENEEYERNFWDIVLDGLRKVLAKIGINVPLSQNDVRWLMWQSYNANKQSDILNLAKRQVVANKLGFTLRQQAEKAEGVQEARNRFADESLAPAARIYNKDVLNWMNRLHETWVDKDSAVHLLVNAIEKATGNAAKVFEDVRLALNQQSSKGLAAIEKFEREYWVPMQAAIRSLMVEKDCDLHEIERYVMLKHGLERNVVFAKRDAKAYYQDLHDGAIEVIDKAQEDGKIDKTLHDALVAKEDAKLEKHVKAVDAETDVKYKELRKQDYGGLTALFSEYDAYEPFQEGVESEEEYQARVREARHPMFTYIDKDGKEQVDMAATEEAAQKEVSNFEDGYEKAVEEMWKRINAATKSTLKHHYDSNMMSRDQYMRVKDMFKYYVPLRGFADNTAEDMYDYYQSDQRNDFTPPLLKAKGRKSEAESPFGYIGAMASSGIAADMKNETKLALYYFVSNRAANDLVNISEVWYEKTGTDEDGKSIFTPVYPPLNEDLSSEEAKKAYDEWEAGMKEKAKAGMAFKGTRKLNLHNSVIHIDKSQEASHVIKFRVGGREMMMYINGNPRAAQAINNELNVEMSSDYQKVFGKILRWFSGINTSYNPEFWLSNAQRDALFALMSVNIKEDSAYNDAFRKNFTSLLRDTLTPGKKGGAYSLKHKLDKGELGDERLDKLYKEFVENGGVTGYTTLKNNEEWELELRKYTGAEKKAMQAVKKGFEAVQHFGEAIEQMTRFAAYITSREQGKEIKDAVNDAKELTVNFNRKGSGKAITFKEAGRLRTKDGKKLNGMQKAFVVGASWLPVYGRRFIMFFNASVQGLNAMYKLYKKNPSKMGYWAAGYLALGVIQALVHGLLDDDDDYLDIPDYERRNNLLLGADGVYFKWALPQECRVFYGLGDMIVNHAMGREPHKSLLYELTSSLSDIAPLNPAGGISAIAPSALTPIVEVALNRDYKGSKIFNDLRYLSDEERKRTPAYQRAYQGTGKVYVLLSQFANWLSGGDYADAGWLNINPAAVEHIFQGATGGAGTTLGKLYRGTVGQVLGEDFTVRNTPFLSRILTVTDDRYRNVHTTELFDYYKAEAEHTKKLINTYRKNGDDEKLDRIFESKDYEIMRIYDSYKHMFKYYNDELKETTDKKDRKALMREQDALRKEMIQEISNIED